jgi:hypothetical protein
MDGGAPTMLSEDSSGYSYRLSPFDPDQIVFVNRVGERPDQTDEVRLGSVNAGTSRLVYSTESATALSTPPELAFLPDGRGLLLLDELSRLLFVPSVGQPLVLAENVSSFQSDPSGCVAAYVSDQPEPGTYLVLIP